MHTQTRAATHHHKTRGFTLIELMLVLVLIALFAGLIYWSVDTLGQRKREQSINELSQQLALIRLTAIEQHRTLGIVLLPIDRESRRGYQVKEYIPITTTANKTSPTVQTQNTISRWKNAEGFEPIRLAPNIDLRIQLLSQNTLNTPISSGPTEPLIYWTSQGDATPCQIELFDTRTSTNKRIGHPIFITAIGTISQDEQGQP